MRMRPAFQCLLLFIWHECLLTAVTSANVCNRPPEENGSELSGGQLFFEPGTEVTLSCSQGYSSAGGSRKIICRSNGEWTKRELKCNPKRCPVPESPQNGKADFEGIVYQNVITYSCLEGYILVGASQSKCLHTGQWSEHLPQCEPVVCDLPVIPPYAKIVYDREFSEDTIEFGFGGTYECLPPFVLFGEKRATCTANGTWSEPPECKLVTCPQPTVIENGFLSFAEIREHGYMEKVKYGCNHPYVLEGPVEAECKETGLWSGIPACRAPCKVNIKKGRIMYKGIKIWIEDFKPNLVLHSESVTVYCLNEERKCGYPVTMQCNDRHMPIPNCYKEPGYFKYNTNSGSLPSEIEQCN
ncbi:beta-2-glycoprotein 1-like [Tachysurus vachellii]|uniref:beta-2-glycoprotein 1-like n=1 Tax=Tachysurus vachellii TaxID=175792 RepID=UPI00296AFB63|nr:beta-2-glycoprotein 1-like [Tachysurus vachellii]